MLTKHQSVQVMEAAQVLMNMLSSPNDDAVNGGVDNDSSTVTSECTLLDSLSTADPSFD